MKGITLAEQCHIVSALPPVDIGGGAKTSDYWSMKNYEHATIIVTLGVVTGAPTILLYESDDLDGSNKTAIGFDYYLEATTTGDTLADRATAASTGYTFTATTNSVFMVIEVDAAQLTDAYPCMCVMTDAVTALCSMVVILSGAKYQKENTPTAIA